MSAAENLLEQLRTDPETTSWFRHVEAIGEPTMEILLPDDAALPSVLIDLAVPHEDINDVVAMRAALEPSDVQWLLRRCVHSLVRQMGDVDGPPIFPALPPAMGTLKRYFFIFVYLAALPHVRQYHQTLGIADDVTRHTLADLGRNMAHHRRKYGVGGLDVPWWLSAHFRGAIYQLGRLQFERAKIGNRAGQALQALGAPYTTGDPTLSIHIPAFSGPISPRWCDIAVAHAREFFPRHFPSENYEAAVCYSWLLDRELRQYLPDTSNIIRFQRRFRQLRRLDEDDDGILQFVFGRTMADLDTLPQRTTLERAVVNHLKSGGHWHGEGGWLQLAGA